MPSNRSSIATCCSKYPRGTVSLIPIEKKFDTISQVATGSTRFRKLRQAFRTAVLEDCVEQEVDGRVENDETVREALEPIL
jgi:hypothetical protein